MSDDTISVTDMVYAERFGNNDLDKVRLRQAIQAAANPVPRQQSSMYDIMNRVEELPSPRSSREHTPRHSAHHTPVHSARHTPRHTPRHSPRHSPSHSARNSPPRTERRSEMMTPPRAEIHPMPDFHQYDSRPPNPFGGYDEQAEKDKIEKRFYLNELSKLKQDGAVVESFSEHNTLPDLEHMFTMAVRAQSEKNSMTDMEDFFELGIKICEFVNQKAAGGVLPLRRYSSAVRSDMARFRPILARIARENGSLYTSNGNPKMDLLKALGMHLVSFCLTKMLKGPETAAAPAPVAGPNVRVRRVLDPP